MTTLVEQRRAQAPAAGGPPSTVRRDVQVLRAVAVAAVVVFHLWPQRLPGGYVGVDVFFVISGFLITSHLLRRPPTSLRGLAEFWGRRVRRLLPAACVVLVVTALASLVLLPSGLLAQAAHEVLASAFSVENWSLARQATDYLAAESTPSPVQHFWSLGVEEQFYLLWPVLLGALALLGRRISRPQLVARLGIMAVVVASFLTSVLVTADDPARAYFVTTTRMWELGLGGLVALAGTGLRAPGWVRATLAWAGLAAIAWAALRFGADTPFPGVAALLPTAGTALVVVAATDDVRGGPSALLGGRPVVGLGDVSYSVYLWHWPLVVLLPFLVGDLLDLPLAVGVVVTTLLLAAASKRFVEDRFRTARVLRGSLPRTGALLAAGTVLSAGVALGVHTVAEHRASAEQAVLAQARAGDVPCFGAEAARDPGCDLVGDRLLMGPTAAALDRSELYADGCWNNAPFATRNTCTYGSEHPTRTIALLGNSHAGQWEPALVGQVERNGWQLRTFVASECYTVDVPLHFPSAQEAEGCSAWNDWAVQSVLDLDPDLVVMSNRTLVPLEGVSDDEHAAVAQAAYARVLDRLTAHGIPVLVLRDTPAAHENAPDCVARERGGWRDCVTPADVALEPDPLSAAARQDPSGLVSVADLSDMICRDGVCHDVVGGVLVYFDHGHLTRTFAETLRPEVEAAVSARLQG